MSRFYSDLARKKNQAKNPSSSTLNVRKSQIGAPSSTFTTADDLPPLPPEVLLDPNKDPNNFFAAKNLSAISLVNPEPLEHYPTATDDPRTRSRSEGRLYNGRRKGSLERGPSSALSVEMRSRSNSKSPLFRDKNRHGVKVDDSMESQFYVPSQHVTTTEPVPLRREQISATPNPTIPPPAIYDKYKKLSMINELCARSGSISSSSSSSSDDYFHAKRKTSLVVVTDPPASSITPTSDTPSPIILSIPRPSSSSSSSDDSDSSGGGGDDGDDDAHTEFEYRVLTSDQDDGGGGGGNLSSSRTNLLSTSQDFLLDDPPNQIQIIDCSKAHVRTKSVDLMCIDDEDDEVTKGADDDTNFYENPNPQIYFQNSIYESNV